MSILGDVFRELFKMFVADLRLTMSILAGVGAIAILMHLNMAGPVVAALLLLLLSLGVLGETVRRSARGR